MNALQFLHRFHPAGPWVLTAIRADRKGIETRTFQPQDAQAAGAWVAAQNRTSNVYFSVNLPDRPLSKKAERADVASVAWLHVDVDARVGEPLPDELARIRRLLDAFCDPRATCCVMSGGGYQAFWRLAEAIAVDGDLGRCEDAALYNKQLEIVLGGDNCSNVDRIMRLPGTVNIPSPKKAARGRMPVTAEVAWFEDTSYPLARFTQAPRLQGERGELEVELPTGNVERLGSVDDLDRWKVPERVKVVVAQGYDPDNPKDGDNSRSAWLFDACCGLARAGVPDAVIYGIVTDPHLPISASVLDKGPNAEKYALRQIQRAKDESEEPWLRRLNDRHVVIGNVGGRCRVMEEQFDHALGRAQLSFQSFGDFRNRYANVYIPMKKSQMQLGGWWLGHPHRRQADTIVFTPGRAVPGVYNMWQGFACPAVPGDKHERFLEHVRSNICRSNDDHYRYLLGWLARCVQHPERVGETAVVLRGRSGVGKTFFVQQFGAIFGRHFMQVSDAKHLVGNFNAHLRDCVVLFGDEAFYAGDKRHESVLKTIVTSPTINIEQKGLDVETQPNYIHLLMASNADWVVPSGPMERRFLVLDVGDEHMQDNEYFAAIAQDLDAGGREALLHFLLSYDLSEFDVYRVPQTEASDEQKQHSLDPMQDWWLSKLDDGLLFEGETVAISAVLDDYVAYCDRFKVMRRASETRVGMFLKKYCPPGWPRKWRSSTGSPRKWGYTFPPLGELRAQWKTVMGWAPEWGDDGDDR